MSSASALHNIASVSGECGVQSSLDNANAILNPDSPTTPTTPTTPVSPSVTHPRMQLQVNQYIGIIDVEALESKTLLSEVFLLVCKVEGCTTSSEQSNGPDGCTPTSFKNHLNSIVNNGVQTRTWASVIPTPTSTDGDCVGHAGGAKSVATENGFDNSRDVDPPSAAAFAEPVLYPLSRTYSTRLSIVEHFHELVRPPALQTLTYEQRRTVQHIANNITGLHIDTLTTYGIPYPYVMQCLQRKLDQYPGIVLLARDPRLERTILRRNDIYEVCAYLTQPLDIAFVQRANRPVRLKHWCDTSLCCPHHTPLADTRWSSQPHCAQSDVLEVYLWLHHWGNYVATTNHYPNSNGNSDSINDSINDYIDDDTDDSTDNSEIQHSVYQVDLGYPEPTPSHLPNFSSTIHSRIAQPNSPQYAIPSPSVSHNLAPTTSKFGHFPHQQQQHSRLYSPPPSSPSFMHFHYKNMQNHASVHQSTHQDHHHVYYTGEQHVHCPPPPTTSVTTWRLKPCNEPKIASDARNGGSWRNWRRF